MNTLSFSLKKHLLEHGFENLTPIQLRFYRHITRLFHKRDDLSRALGSNKTSHTFFDSSRGNQFTSISILRGRTGTGKTLAYLLPIIDIMKSRNSYTPIRQSNEPLLAVILTLNKELVQQLIQVMTSFPQCVASGINTSDSLYQDSDTGSVYHNLENDSPHDLHRTKKGPNGFLLLTLSDLFPSTGKSRGRNYRLPVIRPDILVIDESDKMIDNVQGKNLFSQIRKTVVTTSDSIPLKKRISIRNDLKRRTNLTRKSSLRKNDDVEISSLSLERCRSVTLVSATPTPSLMNFAKGNHILISDISGENAVLTHNSCEHVILHLNRKSSIIEPEVDEMETRMTNIDSPYECAGKNIPVNSWDPSIHIPNYSSPDKLNKRIDALNYLLKTYRRHENILVFFDTPQECKYVFEHPSVRQCCDRINYITQEIHVAQIRDTLTAFRSGRVRCLFTTDILSRGIDLNLSMVVMFRVPDDPILYIHRAGRTGRMRAGDTIIPHGISLRDTKSEPLADDYLPKRKNSRTNGNQYQIKSQIYMIYDSNIESKNYKNIKNTTKEDFKHETIPSVEDLLDTEINNIVESVLGNRDIRTKLDTDSGNFKNPFPLSDSSREPYLTDGGTSPAYNCLRLEVARILNSTKGESKTEKGNRASHVQSVGIQLLVKALYLLTKRLVTADNLPFRFPSHSFLTGDSHCVSLQCVFDDYALQRICSIDPEIGKNNEIEHTNFREDSITERPKTSRDFRDYVTKLYPGIRVKAIAEYRQGFVFEVYRSQVAEILENSQGIGNIHLVKKIPRLLSLKERGHSFLPWKKMKKF